MPGLLINKVHHIALICADYARSKDFYTKILGFEVLAETYRAERESYKLDLAINGHYVLELFSFPDPPQRPSRPEACGLRHLAFETSKLEAAREYLLSQHIPAEEIRLDVLTGKRFFFFSDPDGLPLEFYEV